MFVTLEQDDGAESWAQCRQTLHANEKQASAALFHVGSEFFLVDFRELTYLLAESHDTNGKQSTSEESLATEIREVLESSRFNPLVDYESLYCFTHSSGDSSLSFHRCKPSARLDFHHKQRESNAFLSSSSATHEQNAYNHQIR